MRVQADLVQRVTGNVIIVVRRVTKNGNVHIRSKEMTKVSVGAIREYLVHH